MVAGSSDSVTTVRSKFWYPPKDALNYMCSCYPGRRIWCSKRKSATLLREDKKLQDSAAYKSGLLTVVYGANARNMGSHMAGFPAGRRALAALQKKSVFLSRDCVDWISNQINADWYETIQEKHILRQVWRRVLNVHGKVFCWGGRCMAPRPLGSGCIPVHGRLLVSQESNELTV